MTKIKIQLQKRPSFKLKAGSFVLNLGVNSKVMGIINVTTDSFSADGILRRKNINIVDECLKVALEMVSYGADILDVGGESSRPGAKPISAEEEMKRILPVVKVLVKKFKIPISVDTYKTEVAKAVLDCGATMINTIKGTQLDRGFFKVVSAHKAAIILMHMKGDPTNMQKKIKYQNLIKEVIASLRISVENCLESGIKSDRIIIDPGIGFGKSVEHNLEIIKRLSEFHCLGKPILIGTSRKSFIGKILNRNAEDRLFGTLASVSSSVYNGAHVVRVHDVKAARDVVDVTDAILNLKINK